MAKKTGLLGGLMSLGSLAAGFIPGVGPIASKVIDGIGKGGQILSGVGSVAGGASKGAQEGRQDDTRNLLWQQQLRQQNANSANQYAMERAKFGAGERDSASKRALTSGLLGGLQDVNIERPAGSTIPTFNVSGGLRPSALGPEARAALMQQLSQGPMEMPAYRETLDMQLPQAGLGEKILGGIGLGGSLLGGIGQGITDWRNRAQTPPYNTTQDRLAQSPSAGVLPKSPALLDPLETLQPPNMVTHAPQVVRRRAV